MAEELKKKRGRKPKSCTLNNTTHQPPKQTSQPVKKKDRKPNVIFSFDTNVTNECKDDCENDIILKLKVNNETEAINESNYNSNIDDKDNIEAYSECQASMFSCLNEVDTVNVGKNQQFEYTPSKVGNQKVLELLKEFDEKAKNNEWPVSTSICCYWCCHRFDTPPLGLPYKYYNNHFYVSGCFCSLECASAYNIFQIRDGQFEERNNLLHFLNTKLGYNDIIKPAPPREMLKMFGGNMAIEEFRRYSPSKSIYMNFPPMNVLVTQFEEVNDLDITNTLSYIPLDTNRVNRYKEKIKLQRSLPCNNNSLENIMQFSIAAK